MNIALVTDDRSILLPREIAEKLIPSQRFIIIENGEGFILTPVKIPEADEIAKRVKTDSPLSLEEISEEVHKYRKEKR